LEKISSQDVFDHTMRTAAAHRLLVTKMKSARELVGVNLWNAQGDLLNTSLEWPVVPRTNAHREYFKVLKSSGAGNSLALELVMSRFVDGLALVFAQKVTSENGEFLGLITRSLSPRSFEDFFASIALDADAAISLVHSDGTLIARHPRADHLIGTNLRN